MKEAKEGVMSILSYIDSPFKLFVVILLGLLGSVGYFAYQHQGLFLSVYMKSQELPKLNEAQFDDAAQLLFRQTGAEIVTIFTVNPILNKRHLLVRTKKTVCVKKGWKGLTWDCLQRTLQITAMWSS